MDLKFHESDERLELYALNRLSNSDIISVEEHLLVCELCRGRVDETAVFAYSIREELKNNPAPVRQANGWLAWVTQGWASPMPRFALAGALALAAIAVVVLVRGSHAPLPSVASLQLTAMRGAEVAATLPALELDLTFGDAPPGATALSAEVVDETGANVWRGAPQVGKNAAVARIAKALAPGQYYVRLYDSPDGSPPRLVHEYAFRVK